MLTSVWVNLCWCQQVTEPMMTTTLVTERASTCRLVWSATEMAGLGLRSVVGAVLLHLCPVRSPYY